MPDVVQDGVNGLLVPARNPVALAEAMLKLLENAELRSKMGCQARETVMSRYLMDGMIRRFTELYEGTL
jgi:glycosyltransferase involved in cell wall biosynthesis